MARGKKKTQEMYWLIAIVVAVVFVGSLFAAFSSVPDQVFARSEDGAVTLRAVTDSASLVEIILVESFDAEIDGLASPIYEIRTDESALILNGELEMVVQSEWRDGLDLTEAQIIVIDRYGAGSEVLSTVFDLSEKSVSAPIEFQGSVFVVLGINDQVE